MSFHISARGRRPVKVAVALAVLAVTLAACSGASTTAAVLGAPKFGIVSGQNQTATAGDTSLANPVVGRSFGCKTDIGPSPTRRITPHEGVRARRRHGC